MDLSLIFIFANSKTLRVENANELRKAAYSPDGQILVAGAYQDFTVLWNAQTYERIAILGNDIFYKSFAFSPDSQFFSCRWISL